MAMSQSTHKSRRLLCFFARFHSFFFVHTIENSYPLICILLIYLFLAGLVGLQDLSLLTRD